MSGKIPNKTMNSVICGNNTDIMKRLDDDVIDLTVTSPPYDRLRNYKGHSFDFESVAKELYRITKPGGQVAWIVADQTNDFDESGTSFMQALYFKSIGFKLNDTMIYRRRPPPGRYPRYVQESEYMFILYKGRPSTLNLIKDVPKSNLYAKPRRSTRREKDGTTSEYTYVSKSDMKIRGNIWEYDVGYMRTTTDKFAYEHPAMFPEKLAEDHIISWSNRGDVILDPFCGAGTVCKMAKILGRSYIGIDISEDYCNLSKRRVREATDK